MTGVQTCALPISTYTFFTPISLPSLQTYRKVKKLGNDIGVKKVYVVGNKMRDDQDIEFIKSNLEDGEALGFIHYNQQVIDSDRANQSPYDISEATRTEIKAIKERLVEIKNHNS